MNALLAAFTAQIYNEISDYEALAKALREILEKQEAMVGMD